MEDGIYDDLITQGDLGLTIHNLQIKNNQLQNHVATLEEDIQKLCSKIVEMKRIQENLSRNISELFKTSRNEIDRKNRLIAELQAKLDDIIFKRNTAGTNFGFKKQWKEKLPAENLKRCREEKIPEENVKRPKFDNLSTQDIELILKKSEGTDKQYKETNQNQNLTKLKNEERKHENLSQSGHGSHARFDKDRSRRSDSKENAHRRDSDFQKYNTQNYRDQRRYRERRSSKHDARSGNKPSDIPERENVSRNMEKRTNQRVPSSELVHFSLEVIGLEDDDKDTLNESREEGELSENEENISSKIKLNLDKERSNFSERQNDSKRTVNSRNQKALSQKREEGSSTEQNEDIKTKLKSSSSKHLPGSRDRRSPVQSQDSKPKGKQSISKNLSVSSSENEQDSKVTHNSNKGKTIPENCQSGNHEKKSEIQNQHTQTKPKSSTTKNVSRNHEKSQPNKQDSKTKQSNTKNVSENREKTSCAERNDDKKIKNISDKHEIAASVQSTVDKRGDTVKLLDVSKFIESQTELSRNKGTKFKHHTETKANQEKHSIKKKEDDKVNKRKEKELRCKESHSKTKVEEKKEETSSMKPDKVDDCHKTKNRVVDNSLVTKAGRDGGDGGDANSDQEINDKKKLSCKSEMTDFQENKDQMEGKDHPSAPQKDPAAKTQEMNNSKSKGEENSVKLDKKHASTCALQLGAPKNSSSEPNIAKLKIPESHKTAESIEQKISSLFDTPIKSVDQPTRMHKSPKYDDLELTHEGKIPLLHFDNRSNSKEIVSNENMATSTPVTEFQIFKANLPSLEKSNSLSCIQFHSPDNTVVKNPEELSQNNHIQRTECDSAAANVAPPITQSENLLRDSAMQRITSVNAVPIVAPPIAKSSQENRTQQTELDNSVTSVQIAKSELSSRKILSNKTESDHDVTNTAQSVGKSNNPPCSSKSSTNNRTLVSGSSAEASNISLDLLGANLGEYKAEDYPNLTAHCESKDMPDLLNSPLKIVSEKKKERCATKRGPTEAEPLKVLGTNDKKNEVDNIVKVDEKQEVDLSNSSISPGTGESRKKRRRCVLRWAE